MSRRYEEDILKVMAERPDKAFSVTLLAAMVHTEKRRIVAVVPDLLASGKIIQEIKTTKGTPLISYRLASYPPDDTTNDTCGNGDGNNALCHRQFSNK